MGSMDRIVLEQACRLAEGMSGIERMQLEQARRLEEAMYGIERVRLEQARRLAEGMSGIERMQLEQARRLEEAMSGIECVRLEQARRLAGLELGSHYLQGEVQSYFESIQETAAQIAHNLNQPLDLIKDRQSLFVDALGNIDAWNTLTIRTAQDVFAGIEPPRIPVDVAGKFVLDFDRFVRILPPFAIELDKPEPEETTLTVDSESISIRIDSLLAKQDPRLVDLRKRSWSVLSEADSASARLAAHGMRELYDEILRRLAPDDEVYRTDLWLKRKELELKKPTRRMRLEHIAGNRAEELYTMFQFDLSLKSAQKYAHTFSEEVEVVRAHMASLEICIYLVLVHADKRNAS